MTPREYLDEQTAATITVVAEPWTFNREGTTPQLDFIDLYAIDVNRMGEHRQYLVVLQYWPAPDWKSANPTLEVRVAGEVLTFRPTEFDAREIGIGQPVDPSAPRSSIYWYYPVDNGSLQSLAHSKVLSVSLLKADVKSTYVVWKDGSAELSEFAAIALD